MPSTASLGAHQRLPGRLTSSSDTLGWRSVLARTYAEPGSAAEFTTSPTPELLVVVQLSGNYRIESRQGRRWVSASYRPGSMGITAPGNSATLRWRGAAPARTLQLHLDPALLRGTADALGDPRAVERLPDALDFEDPVVLATSTAIGAAVEQGAGPLVAESLAQALATQLLVRRVLPGRGREPSRVPALSPDDLAVVVDHMNAHLAEAVHLQELADLVHTSKYHFVRTFARATGTTPVRYLTRLRMQHGADLLRTSRLSVLEVASACGYASPGHFSAAFGRHHGTSPSAYRRAFHS